MNLIEKELFRMYKNIEDSKSTTCYINANLNPKNRKTTDCVIRAISLVLEQSWESTIREITELGISLGLVFTDTKCIDKYLCLKGLKKYPQPKNAYNKKCTGKEFCRDSRSNGRIVANIGTGHVVAIINGKIFDTWNSSDYCIGNYWK